MVKLNKRQVAYGLVGLGVLFLLQSVPIISALWLIILLAGSSVFLVKSQGRMPLPQRIFAFAVITIVAIATSGKMGGVAATAFPALAFALIYLNNNRQWWAIIPSGTLASIALLIWVEVLFHRWNGTPLLMLGFAATFTVLYLLPPERGGKRWALYPAVMWIVITMLINDPSGSGWFIPLLLIGGGISLLLWWQREQRSK